MRASSLYSLLLSFLLFNIITAAERVQQPLKEEDEKTLATSNGVDGDGSKVGSDGDNAADRAGALEVEEALVELRSIQTTITRTSRFEKKSGMLGTTAYYAKKTFVILFMNGPSNDDYYNTDEKPQKLSKPLTKAVGLLESAAGQKNPDAIYLLAEMSFHGNYTYPRNFKHAFQRYGELAALTGNSTAHYMLGFMHATGFANVVERDQARAMLYHTLAARAGNTRSQMTLAYRHHTGIGTPRNCNEAVAWYQKVAEKAIMYARAGPPGGTALVKEAYRIADDHGGVYGEGASFSSAGLNAPKGGPNSDQNADFDDVLEYLDLMSRKGDHKATFSLGRLHYDGSRTMKRNFRTARKYFMQVARLYWDKYDKVISEDNRDVGKTAAKAAAYLGRFHLRGEGVPQDFDKALRWFRLGVQNGDPYCQYELGLMHLHGFGVRKDIMMASGFFKESANQDWAASQVQLGKLFLDQGDLKTAMTYFELAYRHGHIEAIYHLAEISNYGVGRERSCPIATAYYKVVAEKAEALHSSFEEANRAYEEGDRETALINYAMAAEQGYEQAQANVAYMLDEHRSILSLDALLPWKPKPSPLFRNAALALVYWTRSAKQSNIDSSVKMGDYYLKGYGIEADLEKAVSCYQSASEIPSSAQALWNLGWMHENGFGVEQDFHLAKRYYDHALEVNSESYLPVKLALMKLRVRSWWNTVTHGSVNSIQDEPEETKKFRSWSDWFANFYDDDEGYYAQGDGSDDYLDPMPGGDDLYYDDIEADILETLAIVALAGALAFLVYYRQLRQQNHQRQQNDARQNGDGGHDDNNGDVFPGQQQDGGFFPPPDDPNFDVWRAGGVGH